METVTYEFQAGVAVVTLQRPEVRNAVDDPTAAALDAAFQRFEEDDACAVAVLKNKNLT
jgi:enoyl-CoA hydratase